jgi:predicted esterase
LTPQQKAQAYARLEAQIARAFAKKDYEQAANLCQQAVELAPKEQGAYYNLACARARLGGAQGALASLLESARLGNAEPGHMAADDDLQSIRGYTCFTAAHEQAAENMLKQYQAYKAEYEKAGKKENPAVEVGLAGAYAQLGQMKDSLGSLTKAIELGWADPDALTGSEDLKPLAADEKFKDQFKALVAKAAAAQEKAMAGADIAGTSRRFGKPAGGLPWRLRMSPDATAEKPNHLIVWLHGSCMSVEHAGNEMIEKYAPMFIKNGFALAVFTQKNWAGWTGDDVQKMSVSLNEINKIAGIDAHKPIFLGFSAGGQMALNIWQENPSKCCGLIIDAAYPIEQRVTGTVPLELPKNDAIKSVPILVFVGEKDSAGKACALWLKTVPKWLDAGIPLQVNCVPDKGHQWLIGEKEAKVVEEWLAQVAKGQSPTTTMPTTRP